jgi:hypothetical protein
MPRRPAVDDDEESELRRDVISDLRGHKPNAGRCDFAADALEALWFPTSKAVKDRRARQRAMKRQFWADYFQEEIEKTAAAQNIPKYEALKQVRNEWKRHSSDEALAAFIKRENRAARRRDKK